MHQAHYYYTLSPFREPWAYFVFAEHWISSLICIFVSVSFFRKFKQGWWLLIAAAYTLPLIGYSVGCMMHGIPPLPFGLLSPEEEGEVLLGEDSVAPRGQVIVLIDIVSPMMAAALTWAYLADRMQKRKP